MCEAAIGWTVDYTRDRAAFGHTIADFQNTQFVLADLAAETMSARIFTDWCIKRFIEGSAQRRRFGEGQAAGDEFALQGGRSMPAILRRLRLYDRVSDRARLYRCQDHADRRGRRGGDEADHRA